MSVIGHGIDLVQCERIAAVLERHRDRFLERVLTPAERARAAQFKNPLAHISGRWAAKEAILKMIGTGWRGGIAWTDMEILPNALGAPGVTLAGETKRRADQLGIQHVLLSITHTDQQAMASAIGLTERPRAAKN